MAGLWHDISTVAGGDSQAVALSDKDAGQTITYRELLSRVGNLAALLNSLEDGPLSLLADNGPDWIIADLACLAAGRCLVPVPTFFSQEQREHALDDAGVVYLFAPPQVPLPESYARVAGIVSPQNLVLYRRDVRHTARKLPTGTIKVTYTSGSTGTPKGVCLDDNLISRVAHSIIEATSKIPVKRHLCVLPLATLLENIAGVYAPLLRGAEIVVPRLEELGFQGSSTFEPADFLGVLTRVQPDSMILIPQLLEALVQGAQRGWKPPSSLQLIAVGGGKVSRRLLDDAGAAGLPVYQGYGLSECASVVSLNLPGQNRPGSVGKPLPHAKVRIIEGEIHVDAQHFLGYTDGSGTAATGLLATGDLGYLDADGYLFISGRKKNLIITSFGRNISPEWIEAELQAIPGLFQVAVVGEARPYLTALLVADSAFEDAAIEKAVSTLNAMLPDYARIGRWSRLTEPFSATAGTLTPNGRLKRGDIARKYRRQIDAMYSKPFKDSPARPVQGDRPALSE